MLAGLEISLLPDIIIELPMETSSQFVKITTSGVASNENLINMTIFPFD